MRSSPRIRLDEREGRGIRNCDSMIMLRSLSSMMLPLKMILPRHHLISKRNKRDLDRKELEGRVL